MNIFQMLKGETGRQRAGQSVDLGIKQGCGQISRRLSYQAANLQGKGKRGRQEDAFALVNVLDVTLAKEKGVLAVVADGMGGMKDGQWAGKTVVASIKHSFSDMDMAEDIAAQLVDSIWKASDEVRERTKGMGGSTVVACIIYNEELYFASVGDSGLYLRRNRQIYRLNKEHNIKNKRYLEQIKSGIMEPENARKDPEAMALTQFMGMRGLDTIDFTYRPLPLAAGDALLLCTDGVDGVLGEESILSCLLKPSSVLACDEIEKMVSLQNRRDQDNYTAVVLTCGY